MSIKIYQDELKRLDKNEIEKVGIVSAHRVARIKLMALKCIFAVICGIVHFM
jgi:hypothetical protein